MHRVLVVDDEDNIRAGIISRLARCPVPVEVAGEAGDGQSALEFIESQPVDIVICDIRMPRLDGLAFVSEVRARGYPVQVIVVSGYADFDYACQALRLGAVDYLLKPITAEHFSTAVAKAVREVDKARPVRNARTADFEWAVNEALSGVREDEAVIRQLLESPLLLVRFYGEFSGMGPVLLPDTVVVRRYGRKEYLVFPSDGQIDQLAGKLTDIFNNRNYRMALARPCATLQDMCLNAENAQDRRFWCEDAVLDVAPRECDSRIRDALLLALNRCLCGGPSAQNLKEIQELLSRLCLPPALAGMGEKDVRSLLEDIDAKLRNKAETWFKVKVDLAACPVEDMAGTGDALAWIHKRFCLCLQPVDDLSGRPQACAICAYLEKNHSQEITLRFLSERFGYPPAQLSRMIREKTGLGFSRYLTRLRVEHAAELLKNTVLSITDVALSSGFYDHAYFCHVFRKVYGMAPNEYRTGGT